MRPARHRALLNADDNSSVMLMGLRLSVLRRRAARPRLPRHLRGDVAIGPWRIWVGCPVTAASVPEGANGGDDLAKGNRRHHYVVVDGRIVPDARRLMQGTDLRKRRRGLRRSYGRAATLPTNPLNDAPIGRRCLHTGRPCSSIAKMTGRVEAVDTFGRQARIAHTAAERLTFKSLRSCVWLRRPVFRNWSHPA